MRWFNHGFSCPRSRGHPTDCCFWRKATVRDKSCLSKPSPNSFGHYWSQSSSRVQSQPGWACILNARVDEPAQFQRSTECFAATESKYDDETIDNHLDSSHACPRRARGRRRGEREPAAWQPNQVREYSWSLRFRSPSAYPARKWSSQLLFP